MKQSVMWRAALVILVIVVWASSIFPLEDRKVMDVFAEEAQNTDKAYDDLVVKVDAAVTDAKLTPGNALLRVANKEGIELNQYVKAGKKAATNLEVVDFIRRKSRGKLRLGIDLRGGTEFIIAFDPTSLDEEEKPEAVRDRIIEIIRNRIDSTGVVEPEIKQIGPASISVKIPSVKADDVNVFRKLIESQAKLHFHVVADANVQKPEDDPTNWEEKQMLDEFGQATGQTLYISTTPAEVNGEHVTKASAGGTEFGGSVVNIEFSLKGGELFGDLTRANVNRRMAIVLDGQVYSAPNINTAITGGRCEISGSFTRQEAEQLSTIISSGNLPVKIDVQGEFSTDPTLGSDQVKSGTTAAIVGLVLVIIFMGIFYTTSGIIADLALAANIVLVLGTLAIMRATMTLPGIAGIILTIGMAVDANVLIFERIREELKNGKSAPNAIRNGYDRALSTILDANITTFLTAFILYSFGSGPVRGFAVTLMVGILASLFTALFMTRVVFDALLLSDKVKNIKMFSIIGNTNIDFASKRKVGAIVSACLLVMAALVVGIRGQNALGVDFTGGTALTFNYAEKAGVKEIRTALEAAGYEKPGINYKESPGAGSGLLEIVLRKGGKGAKTTMQEQLNTAIPTLGAHGGGVRDFGGLVGGQFRDKAIWAMIWAVFGIILYITFRFQFSYACGAVAALVHDVIIGVGIFLIPFLGDRQLSLPAIAAVLTIIGYSLNDTIVIFDRIRENIGLHGAKRKFLEILNESINETLSRTLLTSVTTLLVVLVLLLFGGGGINDFALIMMLGILVGTYSSIFVATPVMIIVHQWQEKKQAEAKAQAAREAANAS